MERASSMARTLRRLRIRSSAVSLAGISQTKRDYEAGMQGGARHSLSRIRLKGASNNGGSGDGDHCAGGHRIDDDRVRT